MQGDGSGRFDTAASGAAPVLSKVAQHAVAAVGAGPVSQPGSGVVACLADKGWCWVEERTPLTAPRSRELGYFAILRVGQRSLRRLVSVGAGEEVMPECSSRMSLAGEMGGRCTGRRSPDVEDHHIVVFVSIFFRKAISLHAWRLPLWRFLQRVAVVIVVVVDGDDLDAVEELVFLLLFCCCLRVFHAARRAAICDQSPSLRSLERVDSSVRACVFCKRKHSPQHSLLPAMKALCWHRSLPPPPPSALPVSSSSLPSPPPSGVLSRALHHLCRPADGPWKQQRSDQGGSRNGFFAVRTTLSSGYPSVRRRCHRAAL